MLEAANQPAMASLLDRPAPVNWAESRPLTEVRARSALPDKWLPEMTRRRRMELDPNWSIPKGVRDNQAARVWPTKKARKAPQLPRAPASRERA